ncbi:MAG: hypothetical protein RL398_3296 [Planctomycetota bacterium]
MQIESHATPLNASPQLRYAALHRAIERGLASDEVWRELAEVCVALGHRDEAARCPDRIVSPMQRRAVLHRLERAGIAVAAPSGATNADAKAIPAGWFDESHGHSAAHGDHDHAAPRLREHLQDALQYLLMQHMPGVALAATLAFPLLVGLGGLLTAGSSLWLLAGLAAMPGLMALAFVGAMGRRILVGSTEGSNDVPSLGELRLLAKDARRFVVDAALVGGSYLVPPLVAMSLGAPLLSTLPSLLLGLLFAPMAWALRAVRGDLASLSPALVMRAANRLPRQYFALAGICWALLVPALGVAMLVTGRPVWTQIAVIGPLVVLPLFVASRLLGTWLETRRRVLGPLLQVEVPVAPIASKSAAPAAVPPAALAPAASAPSPQPTPAPRAPRPAAHPRRAAEQSAPASRAKAAPATPAARTAAPAKSNAPKAPARTIEGRSPQLGLTDLPDLRGMPGAMVVSGRDRHRQGASARGR